MADVKISDLAQSTSPSYTDILELEVSGVSKKATIKDTVKAGAHRVYTITSSSAPTIDTDAYDYVSITALAEDISSMSTNLSGTPINFQKLVFRIKDNGVARSINWGASFQAGTIGLPTTTIVGKTLLVGFMYDSVDAKWTCEASGSRS